MPADTPGNIILELENIGCLRRLRLEFKPGINIIKAPNASGKTTIVRSFSSMFSDKIPPSHILALDELKGRIRVYYGEKIYEKVFRRTPSGHVIVQGDMLPFADPRAFDACVALAETDIVHRITGGNVIFRRYLENLSYGNYYSALIEASQELVNEYGRKLASPSFRNFEILPLLLTDLTDLHMRRDEIRQKIENSKKNQEDKLRKIKLKIAEKNSALSQEKVLLSQLYRDLSFEKEREKSLQELLSMAGESSKIVSSIKISIASSQDRQTRLKNEIKTRRCLLKELRRKVEDLREKLRREEKGPLEIKDLEEKLEKVNKMIILKEEEIQRAERFPSDDAEYPGKLIVDVRSEILRKIEWLEMVMGYFQEKYMRCMTSARRRFNDNVTRAFHELNLGGFENVFLDQDFSLQVMREGNIRQPIETLSASEKLTISLLLMLAAKETFLPEFPLFIVDELTLSYDPERFWRLMEYVKRRVPYLIVTSLSSSLSDTPKVIHKP
ncbi:hypothetical protein DRO35_02720 [Candidatus Bathyarchaeota archaeon]|nr:MAG: hypothetical protein DRO35_02720 [Candidatus Bathyarchaeota archaeon]